MKNLFLLSLTFILSLQLYAQKKGIYMPLEIEKAYEEGTRSWDGTPGENYWQNTADYTIQVSVDPSDRSLKGSEKVTYYNNSPNELNTLVIRLYNDVFKKGGARAMAVKEEDIDSGVVISKLKVNGTAVDLEGEDAYRSGTNMYFSLAEPLASGASVTLETEWSQFVPLTLRRTGVYDSSSYFVGYWYPQIAVYDDVFGWDTFDYTFQTEMYNNLANFDVKISIPNNFTIWATGELQNPQAVFNDKTLKKFKKALTSKEVIHVIDSTEMKKGFSHKGNTWHYVAKEVTDFAFATSDHYLWDAAMQKVGDRNVLVSSAFPAESASRYTELTNIQQRTIQYFSENIPGVPYPYPAFTTFIGLRGGGMEFPMMANNDGPGRGLAIHELFHTYFPMYVRINERRFAWMDEGWANYITQLVSDRFFEENDDDLFGAAKLQLGGVFGTYEDLPLITSTQFMDDSNYGYASYPLPQFVYAMLHHHLGDEVFLKAFRTYVTRWAQKSPTPYDFFYTFEDVSGEDLSWLWKPWFFNYGYADLQIKSWESGKLAIANNGDRPVPLLVELTYKDGTKKEISRSAKELVGNEISEIEVPEANNIKMIMVNRQIPDADDVNNIYPSLDKLYDEMAITDEITGSYQFNEYPVKGILTKKDDGYFLKLTQSSIAFYLIPLGNNKFESLDGEASLELKKEGERYTGLSLSILNYFLTAEKIE